MKNRQKRELEPWDLPDKKWSQMADDKRSAKKPAEKKAQKTHEVPADTVGDWRRDLCLEITFVEFLLIAGLVLIAIVLSLHYLHVI